MLQTSKGTSYHARLCFFVLVLACSPLGSNAQTDSAAEVQAFVLKAYNAYQQKDQQTLFSLHSEGSPYFAEFKQEMLNDFSQREKIRIKGMRVLVVKAEVHADKATLRVMVNTDARDIETGRKAEGFPEWDHTLYLVKEQGDWRLWRFVDTAEEFTGAYIAARTDDERAALLAKAAPLTQGFRRGLLDVGRGLLEGKGDDKNAILILNLVLKLTQQLKDIEGSASALVALGDVSFAQGDYARAAGFYQDVLKQCEDLGIKMGVAAMLTKMGNLHHSQGNDLLALEHYQKSLQLYRELDSRIEIAYPLGMIGDSYFSQHDFEKALESYQQSLKIYEHLFDRAGTAWFLNKIGDVYAAQRKTDLALGYFERSLKADEELGNKAMQAYSLTGIGRISFAGGRYAEAISLFSRAAILARANNSLEILWKALNLLGQSHRALRENDQARPAFAESIAVIEQLRGQVVGSERDQELSFESKTAPYLEMVELLIEQKDLAEAFVYAERAKGRMLLDVLRNGRADITKSMTAEEREKERSLSTSLNALSSLVRRESSLPQPAHSKLANFEDRLKQARLEYEAYETRIYAAHPELKTQRGDAQPLSVDEAESLIPDAQTALLEYVVAQEKTYLFVLTRATDTEPRADRAPQAGSLLRAVDATGLNQKLAGPVVLKVFTIAISSTELARRVAQFRQIVAGNSLGFKEPSRQLYELLLQPAQKELAGKKAVCIVPSNQLWELPFQALLSPADRYFLQDHALVYVPSLSVLREMRRKDAPRALASSLTAASAGASLVKVNASATDRPPTLLAMGNPTLSKLLVSGAKSNDRSLALTDLPEAEREVKTLGEIYGAQNSKILTGAAAREGTVKADAWRYPILHFATHGLLDDNNPLYSRLLLASSSEDDDGLLEAREIMKLDLHANLVVLSACQTARGEIGAGEGLIGMSWAFFIAGASTTVVSQWKVDSASTARLMVDFHRSLRGTDKQLAVSKAEALRQAALRLMSDSKYGHPFFWSGFVVVGNGM